MKLQWLELQWLKVAVVEVAVVGLKRAIIPTYRFLTIFSLPFMIFALLFSLPPISSRNSDQPLGHIAGFSSHPPLRFVPCNFVALHYERVVPCVFIARRLSLFLPSSTRVESVSSTALSIYSFNFKSFYARIAGAVVKQRPTVIPPPLFTFCFFSSFQNFKKKEHFLKFWLRDSFFSFYQQPLAVNLEQ